jgi:antitoxin component YwqK of YwqJK toxin-antitoxin module
MTQLINQFDSHLNRHGVWEFYYDMYKSMVSIRVHYHHGKLNGSREDYFSNGNIQLRGQYIHDEYYGLWKYYSIESKLVSKGYFLNIKWNKN